jgi:hypothetical protein
MKKYSWYNNGIVNLRVKNNNPPEGFVKGYIIVKEKIKRLDKLNKYYERKINDFLEKTKKKTEQKIKELEQELIQKQKKIYPDI